MKGEHGKHSSNPATWPLGWRPLAGGDRRWRPFGIAGAVMLEGTVTVEAQGAYQEVSGALKLDRCRRCRRQLQPGDWVAKEVWPLTRIVRYYCPEHAPVPCEVEGYRISQMRVF